jgi:hypothetical protein
MSDLPLHLFCSRCGGRMERGKTYYIVSVTLTAEVEEGIPADVSEGSLNAIFAQIEEKSEQELEEEVYQKLQFILCKPCRDIFVSHPVGKDAAHCPSGQT